MRCSLLQLTLLVFGPGLSMAADQSSGGRVQFNRDIRPILSENCFFCHGPDAHERQADLRLDVREAALAQGALVPGKSTQSAVIERILSNDPDLQMPPATSNKVLTPEQKSILRRWVDEGAEYERHWAYQPPVKPEVPAGQSAIDYFINRRLQSLGMTAADSADRRTLVRRLFSDLVGLPPTPEEVQAFIDDTRPDAYERLVERLLNSPHYGERMALPWLDVVRYADTIGYHSDTPRNVWPYRDWVIAAFNENKPFDRFTIEQIAGDLLPDASQETRVGSAFNRLLLSTEEGGAQAKDYESRMLADRVRAIGAVWLGQTTGCAQCHDHKFDPFTMHDFYSLGAFFADIQEPIIGRREDGMIVASPEEHARLAQLDQTLAQARQKFQAIEAQLNAAQQQWEADVRDYQVKLPELLEGSEASSADRKTARQVADALRLEKRNANQNQFVQTYFRSHVTKLFASEREELAAAESARQKFYADLPKCLVSVSTTNRRVVRIQPRGNWMDDSGEIVKPELPHYLPHSQTDGRSLSRLDLAQWLVSKENPLTARVTVNRFWHQFFGTGLTKTLDDFGAQGEVPMHPELLDWLACEFMDHGWDVKHIVRQIVTSETYRRSSHATPEQLATDPYNRQLARQSAFRLDAELVRDNALKVSGLLVTEIGGPSVKPYQPDGYWENLNFPRRVYAADTGADQYRRGLYTWWQRSFLHPSLLAFDAPTREECAAERNRSNIPQQALVLLNDPTYVEAARSLAARLLAHNAASVDERLRTAGQYVLQRNLRPEELQVLRDLYSAQHKAYTSDPQAAGQLLKIGDSAVPQDLSAIDLAAWTHVSRVLLNLHETITRP